MVSKSELIERSRYYFDNKEVNLMYATEDNNFFYENSKNYADSHAKSKNIEVITITRADLIKEKPEIKKPSLKSTEESNDSELEQLRKEAKILKIRGYAIMKVPALKKKITEANGST